jgi:hypothetical protein
LFSYKSTGIAINPQHYPQGRHQLLSAFEGWWKSLRWKDSEPFAISTKACTIKTRSKCSVAQAAGIFHALVVLAEQGDCLEPIKSIQDLWQPSELLRQGVIAEELPEKIIDELISLPYSRMQKLAELLEKLTKMTADTSNDEPHR